MAKVRVADYVVDYLADQGAKDVFLLAGGGMMHLLDAVGRSERLSYICNHHEQACAIAADAYARASEKLGVCFATSGPGGANTVTGVIGAWQDSSSVVFISGQSNTHQTIKGSGIKDLRQFGTFEVDIVPIVESVTKYSVMVNKAEDIRFHLEKACYLAKNGRPGPVFLDIPLNIQGAQVEVESLKGFTPPKEETVDLGVVEEILLQLQNSQRPLVLAGYGVRSANQADQLMNWLESMNLPVITTPFAVDLMPFEHPLFVGHPGMKGDRAGNLAVQSCDCLIVVGSSLHLTTTGYELELFAPKANIIQIDPDESILKKQNVGVRSQYQMDLRDFIPQAIKVATEKSIKVESSDWHTKLNSWKETLSVDKEPHESANGEINYYDLIFSLADQSVENDIVISDAGSAFYVVGQAFKTKKGQKVVSSGSLGAMGFAVPAATGASVACPDQRVLCVTGDGSLLTNIHDLATIKKNKLNVKMIVVNNDGYLSIRNTQNSFFSGFLVGTSDSSGVWIPDLEKVAASYELPYFVAKTKDELDETLEKALNTEGPVFCEVFAVKEQKIIPTVTSVKLEDGSMQSQPLHNMFPFIDKEELKALLPEGVDL